MQKYVSIVNETDRKNAQKDVEKYNYNSIEFSGSEWALLLICPGPAFIYGIFIYLSGNTTKGTKLIKYSIFISFIFLVIRYAFNIMMAAH